MSRLGVSLAIILLLPAAGASVSTGAAPTGRLAVVALPLHESGGLNYPSDLYVVDVSGRHVRNLTHDKASDGSPEWMPDGRHIIFDSQPSDPQRGTPHIYVIESDGTGRRRLTSAIGGMWPDVSPDGRRILFLVDRPGKQGLYVMDADGGRKRRLTRHHEREGAAWLPDGRKILFRRGGDASTGWRGPTSLFLINADGRGLTLIVRSPSFADASWSPTGRSIALEHLTKGNGDNPLTIADVQWHAGRPVLRPVKTFHISGSFVWSPDGRAIIFGKPAGVWVADARGNATRRRFVVRSLPWSWSPDGRWFSFSLRPGSVEIANASGTERRTVTRKICCTIWAAEWAPR